MPWFGDIILLVFTGILIGAALTQSWPSIIPNNWETLLAGLLALIGAILTITKMEKQIQYQTKKDREKEEKEAEKLKHYAHAKFLIHANLLLKNIREIHNYIIAVYKNDFEGIPPHLPETLKFDEIFDPGIILPNDETSKKIQKILSILQIVQARLPQLKDNDVIGEPEGSLSYVFEIEWLYIQILKDARSGSVHKSDEGFHQYLLDKFSLHILTDLKDSEKESNLRICKAYLEAHKNGDLTDL